MNMGNSHSRTASNGNNPFMTQFLSQKSMNKDLNQQNIASFHGGVMSSNIGTNSNQLIKDSSKSNLKIL